MSIKRILTEIEAGEYKFFGDRNYKKYIQDLKKEWSGLIDKTEIVHSKVYEHGGELESMIIIFENEERFIVYELLEKLSQDDLDRYSYEAFKDPDEFILIDGNRYRDHFRYFLKTINTTDETKAKKKVREYFKKFMSYIRNSGLDDSRFKEYIRDKFGKTPNIKQ